jgi:hypothetical protein
MRRRQSGEAATFMLMPKAAMDENDLSVLREDKVGLAGQGSPMETETQAETMGNLTNDVFGTRVS